MTMADKKKSGVAGTAEKKERIRNEELSTNKMLLVFAITAVFLFFLTIAGNRGWFSGALDSASTVELVVLYAAMAISLISVPAGIAWFCLASRRGKKPSEKLVNGLNLAVCAFVSLACFFFLYRFRDLGVTMAYIILITSAGLGLFYYLFQREFFISSLVLAVSGVMFYFISRYPNWILPFTNHWKLVAILFGVVILAADAFFFSVWRRKGMLPFSGYIRVFSPKFNYITLIISLIYITAAYAVAAIFGIGYLYYAMLGAAALLLGYAIYFILLLI